MSIGYVGRSGRTGYICDWTVAWNNITGDQYLVALEDDRGRLIEWSRQEELVRAVPGMLTLFDSVEPPW